MLHDRAKLRNIRDRQHGVVNYEAHACASLRPIRVALARTFASFRGDSKTKSLETKSRSEGIIPGVIATIHGHYSGCMNGRGGVQYISNFERAGSRSRSNELICAEDRQQFARNREKNIMAGIPVRPRS